MTTFNLHTAALLTFSATLWFLVLFRPVSADPGKYHRDHDRLSDARKSAKKQYISETEQIRLEEKQIIKEKVQDQFELRQSDSEEYRLKIQIDTEHIQDALEYAKEIGDKDLISEREADLSANLKLLSMISSNIEKYQKYAQSKLFEAQKFKREADEKRQLAQDELVIIHRLEYERLKSENESLSDQLANINLFDGYTLIQKKRSSTVHLRDLSEENVNFYRNQDNTKEAQSWSLRKEQHSEELKMLDVQIDFYKALVTLGTSLLAILTSLIGLYVKKKNISDHEFIDWIERMVESILREDLFRDFQESLELVNSPSPYLAAAEKIILFIGFLLAELDMRHEDKRNPKNLKGTGSGNPSSGGRAPSKKPKE